MTAEAINRLLEAQHPALYSSLSSLGRRAFYPQGIPFQAGQAKGTTYNGTIGIFTDGKGGAVPLPSMAAAVQVPPEDVDKAFLYSPVQGIDVVRRAWQEWQHRELDDPPPTTLPVTSIGLAHGLSMVADLFTDEGTVVAVPGPFWGNYRQTFGLRRGAELRTAPSHVDGNYDPRVVEKALGDVPEGQPAVAILNFPSNPGGYSPTADERRELLASLRRIADQRPLVVVCDDAYQGFVFEDGIPRHSLFWDAIGQHDNLIPIKIDGATKEFSFFGGRVGFITFGLEMEKEAAGALESKLKCLLRSTIGSPVALGQMVLYQALKDGKAAEEVQLIFAEAERRFRTIQPALRQLDPKLLKPLPFNAGFFALLELADEVQVSADAIRRHLIQRHDTGVIAVGERYLRLAICSVAEDALVELVQRVEQGTREMA